MAKGLFLTFVALSVGGLAFADYTNQTMRVGAKFGELGVREYTQTFAARYQGMQDGWQADALAADLRAKDPRELLPDAPDGWTMREWNETDRAQLFPPADAANVPAELQAAFDENPLLSGLQAAGQREARAEEIATTRFYQRGDSLIALQLAHKPPQGNAAGITGLSMNIIEGNMAAMSGSEGFAVIKGVAYGQSTGLFGVGGADGAPRILNGRMGKEIRITAHARASDADIHNLLSSIDYDTLNAMMVRPVAGVGSDASEIPLEQQQAIADAALAAQAQELMDRARDSEAALVAMADAITPSGDAATDEAAAFGLGAMFGANAEVASDAEADAPAQVGRIGSSGNCTMIGARKSCGVQPD